MDDDSHALFSQVVKSYWYLQHLFVCYLERNCVLWWRTEIKVKVLYFVLSLLALFKARCSLVIWKKNLFFLSNPYRCWNESWSYWDSVFLGFEIRYSPFGTTIRDLDIYLNMFKCLIYIPTYIYIYIYRYIYFFTCYLLLLRASTLTLVNLSSILHEKIYFFYYTLSYF